MQRRLGGSAMSSKPFRTFRSCERTLIRISRLTYAGEVRALQQVRLRLSCSEGWHPGMLVCDDLKGAADAAILCRNQRSATWLLLIDEQL